MTIRTLDVIASSFTARRPSHSVQRSLHRYLRHCRLPGVIVDVVLAYFFNRDVRNSHVFTYGRTRFSTLPRSSTFPSLALDQYSRELFTAAHQREGACKESVAKVKWTTDWGIWRRASSHSTSYLPGSSQTDHEAPRTVLSTAVLLFDLTVPLSMRRTDSKNRTIYSAVLVTGPGPGYIPKRAAHTITCP
ncbi:hypothetical protein DFH94DRAFT_120414 [Russula ochroleuca]|jgi:hypothetical protein|uniref:Uncharacterized protein n=1 Tax=Russula ochroleuca TaxID=152965 RepID=A0A9P5MRI9_9AGAM|nr:hypothetical protein DFH94DRAFT_120414 [Russula ochroleuca]